MMNKEEEVSYFIYTLCNSDEVSVPLLLDSSVRENR